MNISLAWYIPLALVPVLILLWWRSVHRSIHPYIPHVPLFADLPRTTRQRIRPLVLYPLFLVFLGALFLGALKPETTALRQDTPRRAIMLVIDVSPSMEARDFLSDGIPTSRMNGVKMVVEEFVRERKGDRIGIIVFSGSAFLLSPLTTDYRYLADQVSRLRPGIAGDGTALGDGLALALKRIQGETSVVFLTDGANNSGVIDPTSAAQLAADLGVKVHTIGIGGDFDGENLSRFFGLLGPQVEFDEAMLRSIANKTGGTFAKAGSAEGLRTVYDAIETLEAIDDTKPERVTLRDYYPWCAAVSLFALCAYLLLLWGPLRRVA